MSSNKEKLYNIIVEKLNVDYDEIHDYSSFRDDFGADSLDAVEFIMEVEKEFGISIPDEIAERVSTVGDALRLLNENVDYVEIDDDEDDDSSDDFGYNYALVLRDAGEVKLQVVKDIKEYFNVSLKDAKDAVDGVPIILYRSDDYSELSEIKNILEGDGATVTIQSLGDNNETETDPRESTYRQAESFMSDNKYGQAKGLLMKLTSEMDVWGMFASYDLLNNAEQFGLSENEEYSIAKAAATSHDHTDEFDDTKDFYRCWRECYNFLGLAYMNIDGAQSLGCFQKAANLGLPVAYYNVAYCYQNGIGTSKNIIQALFYYNKAKTAGYESEELNQAIQELDTKIHPNKMEIQGTNSYDSQHTKPRVSPKPKLTILSTVFKKSIFSAPYGHKKLYTFLLGTDLALFISLIGGLSPALTQTLYFAFLIGFSVYWIYKYYQENKAGFWGVPDDNGLMRTFFWRKEPYTRVFKTSMLFLKSVFAALLSILLALGLSLILFAILSLVISNSLESRFCVFITFLLAFILRKADKALAKVCAVMAIYFHVAGWLSEYYVYVGLALLMGVGAFYKKYNVKFVAATLPILAYLASVRFHIIHGLIFETYGSLESGIDILMYSFDNIKVFFLDDFLPYVVGALILAMVPLVLFLVVAGFWMIFAYALRIYDWTTTHVYNVKHPCPCCQENCEPAKYYSRDSKTNKLYELSEPLRPGVYGLFSITHPITNRKMPTLLINGRTKLPRKCHRCGEMISSESGTNKHIAMIGCPGSGKSALCVTMIANMMRSNQSMVLGNDIDSDTKKIILKVVKQGHMTHDTFPQKTREGRLPSLRVNIPRAGRPDYALYLDDVAGESFDTNKNNTAALNFLYNTTSLIFVIDPFTSKINHSGKMMKAWLDKHYKELNPYYNIEDIFSNMRTRINELNRLKKMTINFVLVKADSGYLDKVDTTCEDVLKDFIANEMGMSDIVNSREFKASHFYAVTTVFDDGSIAQLNDIILAQQNIDK